MQRKVSWKLSLVIIVVVAVAIAVAIVYADHLDKQGGGTSNQASVSSSPRASSPVLSESNQIEALAKQKLGKINSFSLIDGCAVDGAPAGSKTVDVISGAGYLGGLKTAAGEFLFDVFKTYPDVYLVQMKGEQDGEPIVQFSMCRADIGGLQAADWYSNYINYARDYWDYKQ